MHVFVSKPLWDGTTILIYRIGRRIYFQSAGVIDPYVMEPLSFRKHLSVETFVTIDHSKLMERRYVLLVRHRKKLETSRHGFSR